MNHFRSLREGTGFIAMAVIILLIALNISGCNSADNSPTTSQETLPPALPSIEHLEFDFSFFGPAERLDKSSGEFDNFFNAYLRTIVLDVMARMVLAAPVEAFSYAINTVPTAETNGAWRWTYKWQVADDEVGIVLLGTPAGDVVEWQLSLVPIGMTQEFLWFSGTTNDNGEEGRWEFRDLNQEHFPICGEIAWGNNPNGQYLEFISLEDESFDNRLVFYDNEPEFRIEFTLGTDEQLSFIQWNSAGDGSLKIPDFNDGRKACWDIHQQNINCQ